jgi:hypothetical protein
MMETRYDCDYYGYTIQYYPDGVQVGMQNVVRILVIKSHLFITVRHSKNKGEIDEEEGVQSVALYPNGCNRVDTTVSIIGKWSLSLPSASA